MVQHFSQLGFQVMSDQLFIEYSLTIWPSKDYKVYRIVEKKNAKVTLRNLFPGEDIAMNI